MGKNPDPQRLKDLLTAYGRSVGLDDALHVGQLWQHWGRVVGPQIAAHAEPTSLKEGILRIRADSPTWATEIGYLSQEIRRRVNEMSRNELVSEVRVWTGPSAPPAGRGPGPDQVTRTGPVEAIGIVTGTAPKDPIEALQRARSAWARRRPKRPR